MKRTILNIILILLTSFMIYNIGKSLYATDEKLKILKNAEEDVKELRLKNVNLLMRKQQIDSDEDIEKEARERLNYGKQNELVFVIPDYLMTDDTVVAKIEYAKKKVSDGEQKQTVSVFEQWKQFFLNGI